ncbi:NAD-dependent epimerase/dehydratase family protein [Aureimonas sp. AU4]|uniref:NAD-dependent epimerase/dehydratase family protein n=1 Tax=Aureimonas sp. AU4 TaxID=1638163 RepID=UPI000784F900|nr:NAD-dependent epimerase/dehydratase family protein [Aureimonas sp. AU4]
MSDRVLVTGASGFIAKHIVLELVRLGVPVRGTVRSAAKAQEVRAVLRRHDADPALFDALELDLSRDEGWEEAARDCRYVLHTASPFPARQPSGKFDLVPPARDGTLRALSAARRAGCERVVVTSSVAAIFYGHPNDPSRVFGEGDVSRVESPAIMPYAVSKTVAEQAAWGVAREYGLSLSTINPALVLGPALDGVLGTSATLIDWMARRRIPVLPDVTFGIADVRDVAHAHIVAMRHPDANGRRFIVSGGERTLRSVAATAREANPKAFGIAPLPLPSWLVHAGARVSPQLAMLAAEVDRVKRLDTTPLRDVLGIAPRSPEVAIRDLVESIRQYKWK